MIRHREKHEVFQMKNKMDLNKRKITKKCGNFLNSTHDGKQKAHIIYGIELNLSYKVEKIRSEMIIRFSG